jgi:hypothetical protein
MDAAKQEFAELYPIRNLGPIVYYLGLSIVRDRKVYIMYFTQTVMIDRILEKAGII